MRFSRVAARALLLAAQGLDAPPERPATKGDVLGCVRRMGVLQIDSIAVVARSPYLVLWSRLGPYEPRWLDDLLAEGALFEYWSHAACFIPIEDYGLYRRFMLEGREKSRAWMSAHPEEIARVLARVREGGEVRSAEFERTDGRAGGWWEWKPEKRALEHLFAAGEIMISRRDPNFHRVYDLRERVLERALPGWEDGLAPTPEEVRRALALKAVRALGVTVARWVPDYFRTPKRGVAGLLEGLADEGELLRAGVEGWEEPAYVHPNSAVLGEEVVSGGLRSTVTTLLSPFDPVVWDRARALELFGFEYRIEVYTPAARRRYGILLAPDPAPRRARRQARCEGAPQGGASSRSRRCTWNRMFRRPRISSLGLPERCARARGGTAHRRFSCAGQILRGWSSRFRPPSGKNPERRCSGAASGHADAERWRRLDVRGLPWWIKLR
jgi:uncharacterized protein YcaQ